MHFYIVDPTPIPQPKSNQNPKLKENNAVKPVPNEQNIDTLRSDPDIHASSMLFSNTKFLFISYRTIKL